jgi:hypothetical protein
MIDLILSLLSSVPLFVIRLTAPTRPFSDLMEKKKSHPKDGNCGQEASFCSSQLFAEGKSSFLIIPFKTVCIKNACPSLPAEASIFMYFTRTFQIHF